LVEGVLRKRRGSGLQSRPNWFEILELIGRRLSGRDGPAWRSQLWRQSFGERPVRRVHTIADVACSPDSPLRM